MPLSFGDAEKPSAEMEKALIRRSPSLRLMKDSGVSAWVGVIDEDERNWTISRPLTGANPNFFCVNR